MRRLDSDQILASFCAWLLIAMPRYYCDYCDTYLTHDSPSVRKQHNAGYKHKANVRAYYQQFEEQQTQSFIDQKVKEHQHMAAFQGMRPMVPVLPRPGMGLPGSSPAPMHQLRPPVLAPGGPNAGYNPTGGYRPPVAPLPGPGNAQSNGVYRPTLTPPGAPSPGGMRPPGSSSASNGMGPPGGYQQQPGSGQSTGPYGGYNYGSQSGGYAQPPGTNYNAQQPPRPGMSSGYPFSQAPPGSGDSSVGYRS